MCVSFMFTYASARNRRDETTDLLYMRPGDFDGIDSQASEELLDW